MVHARFDTFKILLMLQSQGYERQVSIALHLLKFVPINRLDLLHLLREVYKLLYREYIISKSVIVKRFELLTLRQLL